MKKILAAGFSTYFLISVIIFPDTLLAVTADDLGVKLDKIDARLTEIEKQQATLLEVQQQILQKLDTVKIWARRS